MDPRALSPFVGEGAIGQGGGDPFVPTALSRFQEQTVPTGLRQGSPFRPLASSRQRHDTIHATIDFDLGPRSQDGRRLTLFDDGRTCEALADHQAMAVVHRTLDERPSFGEVCGTPPFLGTLHRG